MTRYRCALLAASALAMTWPQQGLAQSTAAYTYDALGRVVKSDTPAGVTTYTYDTADNRSHLTTNLNHPPVANNDYVTTAYQTAVTINPISNDTDPDAGETAQLKLFFVGGPLGGHGTVAASGNTVTFTPAAGFSGTEQVGYAVSDPHGAYASAIIYITVAAPPNRPPVAVANSATANAGGASVTIPVLANDSDPDGDPLTITQVGTPSKGSVQISGGNLIYSATWHQQGTDTFSYTISDGRGGSASANVTVTVNAPVFANPDALYMHPAQLDLTAYGYGRPWMWWACVNALANDSGQNLSINSVSPNTYATYDGSGNVCYQYVNASNNVPSPAVVWYGVVGTGGSDVAPINFYLLPN